MDYRVVNGTAVGMIGSSIVSLGLISQSWTVSIGLALALVLPAIGLFQVAAILKQQQARISQLEQGRGFPGDQSGPQTGGHA
jgi:hypothetical protein